MYHRITILGSLLVGLAMSTPAQIAQDVAPKKRISAPAPKLVRDKHGRYLTGSGVAVAEVDTRTGYVKSLRMQKSTGHPELDQSALNAFRRWRFKPGTVHEVRLPITFTDKPMPVAQ